MNLGLLPLLLRSRGRGRIGDDDDDNDCAWTRYFHLKDERGREVKDPRNATHIISAGHRLTLSCKEWAAMGRSLGASTKMRTLCLRECGLSNARAAGALLGKGGCDSPLESFASKGNRLGARGLEAALPYLRSAPVLQRLTLDGADLRLEGCVLLSRAMEGMHLTSLQLRENGIGNDGAEALLAGDACRSLRTLSLKGNRIGRRGLMSISEFLNRDGTMVRHLVVANNKPMDEGCAGDFVDSLPKESELLTLSFGDVGMNDVKDRALSAVPHLERLVCNTDSFEALCRSNHKLRRLCETDEHPPPHSLTCLGWKMVDGSPRLREALDINARAGTTPNDRFRFKLRAFYFKGRFDVRPFADLDAKLIPNVLEFVTMTVVRVDGAYVKASRGDLDGIYHFVQSRGPSGLIGSISPREEEVRRLKSTISEMEAEMERLRRENQQLRPQMSALM